MRDHCLACVRVFDGVSINLFDYGRPREIGPAAAVWLMEVLLLFLCWLILGLTMIAAQLCDIHTYASLPHRTQTITQVHMLTCCTLHLCISLSFMCILIMYTYLLSFSCFLPLIFSYTYSHRRTHTLSFPRARTITHSKAHPSHTHNTVPPPLPLPATLPLGSKSWSFLKELEPRTSRAPFIRTCE